MKQSHRQKFSSLLVDFILPSHLQTFSFSWRGNERYDFYLNKNLYLFPQHISNNSVL